MFGFQRPSWHQFYRSKSTFEFRVFKPELMSGFISCLCLLQVVSPVTPCVSQSFHISHYFILRVSNALISLHFTSKRLEQHAVEYHVIPVIHVGLLTVPVSNEVNADIWVTWHKGRVSRSEVPIHRDVGPHQGEERKRRRDGWAAKSTVHGILKKKLKLKSQLIKDVSWLTCLSFDLFFLFSTWHQYSQPPLWL